MPYRASAKIDTFCLQIISFPFLESSYKGKKREVKRAVTRDSQLGRSQCELSEFVDQIFGLASTALCFPNIGFFF